MSIFYKIKNLFYEEEIVEEKIDKQHNDQNMNKSIREEISTNNEKDDVVSEREFVKPEQNFKFPVIFEDEDIKKVKEEKVEEKPIYNKPKLDKEIIKEVIHKPKKFIVSPVISPIYGILDKNYKKEDVTSKSEDMFKTKELVINFDTIRQKAYGSLEDEINELIEKEIDSPKEELVRVEFEKETVENNGLLDELKIDDDNSLKNEYDFEDFGVEYRIDNLLNDNTPKHISKVKKKNKDEKETIEDAIEEVKDEEKKEIELTEDLFNLIDSMYDN